MHFFDPSRPRISGLPAFAPGQGVGISVIPALYIAPREDSQMEISAFFSVGANRSSRLVATIHESSFPKFWEQWLSDPEETAKKIFNWQPTTAPAQNTRNQSVSLDFDDLLEGLE